MTSALRRGFLIALCCAAPAAAQQAPQPQPTPLPQPPPIATPRDTPYPGTITLAVNATDLDRHIVQVHETVPVAGAGDLVLLYPEFIPGDHGPTGPLPALAGLVITANGQRLSWSRDVVQVHAFHVPVPPGVTQLDVAYQYLSPPTRAEGRVEMTPNMLDLEWNEVVLYPAGHDARDIGYAPSLTLPDGWKFGTALTQAHVQGATITFDPVTLNVLMDSPVYAGRYFSRVDLDPGAKVPVHLDIVADRPEDLVMSPADLAAHRKLVQQAYRNYGSHHYDHYDFLLSLSDEMGGVGLEHHRSSENGVGRDYFTDPKKSAPDRDLLPHEYTHSWNGKFRRPADLWSPDFDVLPERDSLLWVYEGQTQYWGGVLAARSGILSAAQVRDYLALEAAEMQNEAGRSWRDLEDTTNDPILNMRRPLAWRNWQREEDYYLEGALMWLDADALIRRKSAGQRSLSTFARNFFGIDDGAYGVVTYTFDDVVKALNTVQPYDWAGFLRMHLNTHDGAHVLDGLKDSGWQLTYTATKSDFQAAEDSQRKVADLTWSLGLSVGTDDDTIDSVAWNGPAYDAGLAQGGKIIAVDGLAFDDPSALEDAVRDAAKSTRPIELLVQEGRHFRTVDISYHGGLRYPHLTRIEGAPDLLSQILAPLP
jgi:predicted metalloprotease with PDZ domain